MKHPTTSQHIPAIQIGPLNIHALTHSDTQEALTRLVESPGVSQHVAVNAAKIVAAHSDTELRNVITACDIVSADGMSIVWASRILGAPLPERVAGIDTMQKLIHRAETRGWRIYLLGAKPAVIEKVVQRLEADHPSLQLAGYRHGYWGRSEENEVVRHIRESGADLLFVALPSPNKEHFVGRNKNDLGVNLVVGVGGSFDVLAGHTRRAPKWMQDTGLEWAFRFAQEPRRMWRRYLIGNVAYAKIVFMQWLYERIDMQKSDRSDQPT